MTHRKVTDCSEYDKIGDADAGIEMGLMLTGPDFGCTKWSRSAPELTPDEQLEAIKGQIVAKAVRTWLLQRTLLRFVPSIRDPNSEHFDPLKAARQAERVELLTDLERCIREASESIHEVLNA